MKFLSTLVLWCLPCWAFSQTLSPTGNIDFCVSGTLAVTGAASGTTFQWQLNGTDQPGATAASYTATASGTYRVILVNGAQRDTLGPANVTIRPNPNAGFSFTPSGICMNTPVQFTYTGGTTGALNYAWDFGDPNSGTSNTATTANPTHRFVGIPGNTSQTFSVRLTVTTAFGCTATVTQNVTMNQTPGTELLGDNPTSYNSFTYFTECVATSHLFTFANNSSTVATNTNYQIVWGDGSPNFNSSTFTTTTHTYNIGNYNMLFIVTGSNGCRDTGVYRVFVGSNPAIGFANPGSSSICNGTPLTFQISSADLNPPSTQYTVTFNDGTPPINYSHPPPSSVTHLFELTSCGTSSGAFPNSFSASIEASNPCSRSVVQVVPIYVSEKPDPDFTISPRDTVCTSNTVTFTNTGGGASNNNNGVCQPGKSVWQITPATGWSLISGSLGNDNNSSSVGIWVSGTDIIQLQFTTPGTYSIELKTGNNNCGIDSLVKTICVNPDPAGTFTLSPATGCAPLAVTSTLNTNTPLCGDLTYNWEVTYQSTTGCTPATSSYSFTNGTSATSREPRFLFTNPGVYTIRPLIIAPLSSCSTWLPAQQVIVKGRPVVTLGALPANICVGQSVSPGATASCYLDASSTYTWSFPGATPATASTLNPGSITYNTAGGAVITLAVTNECGTTTQNNNITVNPTPVIQAVSDKVLCHGEATGAINFSTTPAAGVSISWTNSNTSIGLAASGTGNIPSFNTTNTSASSVSSVITVTANLNGCTSTTTFTITVHPRPAAPVTAPVQYCVGETAVPLTATATGSNTLLWYTTASGGTGSTTAPTPSTATAGATTYYVSQLNSTTSCESVRSALLVSVFQSPVITAATGSNPTQCAAANGSIALSGLTPNTSYTVSYTSASGTNTVTLTSNGSGVINITGLTAGSYSNITVTASGCASLPAGPVSLSDPSAPAAPVANSNSPICSGQTLNLTANNVSGGTFAWTGPGGFSSTTQNPVIPNATTGASGTYSVTVTVNGCTSPAATLPITVNATPFITAASSNSPLCTGEQLQLSSTVNYAGTLTYSWTGPGGFTSSDPNPVISSVGLSAAGSYTLQVTGDAGSCSSTLSSVPVTVNETPVIDSIRPTNPNQCSTPTGSIRLYGLTPGFTYQVNYTRNTIAQSITLTADAAGVLIIPNVTAGTYTNFVVIRNGCSSADNSVVVLTDPDPPTTPVPATNAPICSGNALNLTVPAYPGSATYNWTGPDGFNSTVQNPVIPAATTAASGTYSVSVTVNGCTSASGTVNAVVHATPSTPVATSNSPICNGNTLQLNGTSTFTGALSYSWTGPDGFSANIANPSILNAQPVNSGNYTLTTTAVTGNCAAPPVTIAVVVNATPVITSTSFTNPTQCSTPTGSVSLQGLLPNTLYTVSYLFNTSPVTASIQTNASGVLIIPALLAGTYSNITVELNNCISSPAADITLTDPNPPAPPQLTQNGPVCALETLQLNASTALPGTASYTWNGPAGFNSTQQNPSITLMSAANAGLYSATVTINNCTSAAASITVVVHPLPPAPTVNTPLELCINTTAAPLTATASAGNTLNWYLGAGNTLPVPTAPVPSTATTGSTSYYVTQTNTFGCEGPNATLVVQVNPDAQALFTPTQTTGCPPFGIDASVVGLQTFPLLNNQYNWYANNVFIGSGTTFPGYTIPNQNDSVEITLITTSLFGCLPDTMKHTFYTYVLPTPSFTTDIQEGCGPLLVNFQNTTPGGAAYTYHWNFGNGITSTLEQPGSMVFQPNPLSGDTVYNVQLQIVSVCDTITLTQPIRVKAAPIALFSPSRTVGCSPMQVTFVNTTRGNNVTYDWNFGDGTSFQTTQNTNVSHTYFTGVVDTFTVRLIASNECGADTSFFDIITAPNNINLNFQMNGPDQFGCAPHSVPFINNTPGANVFNWNFGDGNILSTTANVDTVYHTFISPGTYTVTLHAENACTDTSTTRIVTVFPNPNAAFRADRYTVCIGEPVQFTNQSDAATSYLWQFGDGTTSTLVNPVHAYAASGTYTVKLNIYRVNPPGNVCVDSVEQQVQVVAALPGSFTVQTSGSCVPLTVTFVNDQRPSQTSVWDFGDGNTGLGDSVVHTYQTTGVFTVRLTAVSPGGCTYTSSQVVRVNGVSGSLTYPGGFVCSPNAVRLEVSGSNIQSIAWDLDDGTTFTNNQRVIFHTYAQPGTYIPSVVLQSADGCTYPIRGTDTIKVDRITAGYTHTVGNFCGYTTVRFTDTSSVFFGKNSVLWNFGDGNTGSGVSVEHQYSISGTYSVQMIVTGNSGCADTVTKQITINVNSIPSASIVAPVDVCTGEDVLFNSVLQSIDPVTLIQWTISNGTTFTGDRFNYTFTQSGNYTVRLIAGTPAGCLDTAVHSIQVRQSPVVRASSDVTYCLGGSAQLSVTGGLQYQWAPNQGLSCNDCANPVANPTVTTPYLVTGTAANGCTATDTVVVTVIQPLVMDVSDNDTICIGQSAPLMASGAATYVWSPGTSLSSTTVSNPVATPSITTTYRVIGYDGQNCYTDTAYVVVAVGQYPTVSLGPDQQLPSGTQLPLATTIQNGPIAQWEWTPTGDLDCADCPLPTAYIRNNITYTVRVTNIYGCDATDEMNIKVFCTDGQVFIPNAFTPDGDGVNDILMVRGTGIARVKSFRIFNRWGEVVFERSNFLPNNPAYGWNGKVRGKDAPPDVFVFTAEVICDNGTPYTYKGNVSIIK
ncbi:MAG TPA: PKD domain-containing protein [Ferruginibacter sp.]|nr:PKD domain-containing protein [Ferruginibacter sp.]HRO05357.1 PKD domain-containing protein [Ferruginibacter sp.]HRO96429.1 PKD domain-containing protein [Ferruginibacter sp.]HRP48545.1 PKD domain-containing protein [Ferruginibacter sp.]